MPTNAASTKAFARPEPVPYFDHHAATPLCREARAAMQGALSAQAHPSSLHAPGRAARAHVEAARRALAEAIGAAPADIVLTSGGTEAVNLALHGERGAIATTALEHPAVSRSIARRAETGSSVMTLAPATLLSDLDAALARGASLVAVQWVNHETGRILPVSEIVERAHARGARVLVDATQALGKLPIDVRAVPIDMMAVSSAKIGGPIGMGALHVRRGITVDPLMVGGREERGLRAGTVSPVIAAGFAAALGTLGARLAAQPRIARQRDALERFLVEHGALPNEEAGRVATVTNVALRAWRGTLLVAALDLEGLSASSGAACSSGLDTPSPVLLALHPNEPWRAACALRLSLGVETTDDEVQKAEAILARVLARAR